MSEEEKIKVSKIEVDRDKCIAVASCVEIAGETFELDDENKAVVKKQLGDDGATIFDAAKSCPVNAIFLYDENGKKIWPVD
ncbi:ferredoxin [Patescibacteria group bacterium]